MRKSFSMLAVVLAIAALSTGVALGAPQGTDRPLKVSGSTVNTIDFVNLTFVGEGSAHITHLGRSTIHIEGVITGATTSAFTTTVTAANGDTLTAFGTGAITLGPNTFTNLETITGGTGRFAGATGTFTDTGTFALDPSNPNRSTITFTSTGTISY